MSSFTSFECLLAERDAIAKLQALLSGARKRLKAADVATRTTLQNVVSSVKRPGAWRGQSDVSGLRLCAEKRTPQWPHPQK